MQPVTKNYGSNPVQPTPMNRILIRDLETGLTQVFPDGKAAGLFMWGHDSRRYITFVAVGGLSNEVTEYGRQLDGLLSTLKEPVTNDTGNEAG